MPKKNNQTVCTPCDPLKAPDELRPFADPSLPLPGENLRDYEVLRRMIVDDIQPLTTIEWLRTLDLIELSWEIMR